MTRADPTEGTLMIALIVIVVVLVVLAGGLIALYNGIVGKRNRCDNAWQHIDAQLQRRADLIPNLVETVKGYAAHESKTLEAVIAARGGVAGARTPEEKIAADNVLTGALRQLFAVAEAYPDLKANANFQQLQAQLEETENKIVYARQSYNDCVLMYNNAIQMFPGNLVAGVGGFAPRSGFEAEGPDARQAPKVQF